ncbi:MAG TPA: NAD(P)-dependent alcohol dehydrogenase [Actinocrinis sp.]
MKAIRYHAYGSPDVLEYVDVGEPVAGDGEVLVRVRAAAVNPLDWHLMRGTPYVLRAAAGLTRPREAGLGADAAGVIEAVGPNVTDFRIGDEVFADGTGTFAELVVLRADGAVFRRPPNLTFEQAAAVPVAGMTALQALRDKGGVQAGHSVLVNGAAGGVGTFAVQIAKAFGAEVTGVCSAANADLVRSLGADHVVDYTREDFTDSKQRYDVVLDIAASRSLAEVRRVLAPSGVLVGVGAANSGRPWIGPLARPLAMAALSPVGRQNLVPMLARPRRGDLAVLRAMLEDGQVVPVIDRMYPLAEVSEAIRYAERGHARGKVVITVGSPRRVVESHPDEEHAQGVAD